MQRLNRSVETCVELVRRLASACANGCTPSDSHTARCHLLQWVGLVTIEWNTFDAIGEPPVNAKSTFNESGRSILVRNNTQL